ncbi:MAG: aspartate aminotransferase family protein [Ginsengibacter sp.]
MNNYKESAAENLTLDPGDWTQVRALGHRMIDDMMDHLEMIREKPVWRIMPDDAKQFLKAPIPQDPQSIDEIYAEFLKYILPYNKGNIHPRFFAWVQGTGTPFSVLAEMLATTMNPNVTIGEHAPMYVDNQVVEWCKQLLNFPQSASGILLSGASMANVTALTVARDHQLGFNIRKQGVGESKTKMTLYCSSETHSCVQKAVEIIGLGTDAVRTIEVNEKYQIDISSLIEEIEKDLRDGFLPFCIVGNAGTVNTGAIDPLSELAAVAKKYKLWFHIDGAFGALAKLVDEYKNPLQPIENCDSIAFDLHKWMYVPYEVGCTLIKNAKAHRSSFAVTPDYLLNEERGLAGGPDLVSNFGPELSRGFKALKVWMSLKEHGQKKFASMIKQNIAQAFYLSDLISESQFLQLLTPVTLNIVCYRYYNKNLSEKRLDKINKEILILLQERGIAAPSSTLLNDKFAIRVCIVNQRSRMEDFDMLAQQTIAIGNELCNFEFCNED